MNKRSNLFMLAAIVLAVSAASVRAETFYAYLSSAQETPASVSSGTGYCRVVVNESAMTYTSTLVFTGVTSNQTASHIHAPGAIGVATAVAINFGSVGGTSGTINSSGAITMTQLTQIRQHLGYVNLHTSNFPAGEIRGQLGIKRPVDFDGDGRQDFSILRYNNPSPFTYWNLNSTAPVQVSTFGQSATDFPVPGDYDGDGKDDLALYRAGATVGAQSFFYIVNSSNGATQTIPFGVSGDQVVCRDYDGDGITDIAIFRRGAALGDPTNWWIRKSTGGGTQSRIQFGLTGMATVSGDEPIPGDYDGDGKFDVAVYRHGGTLTPNNTFIVLRSSDGATSYQQFGDFTTDYVLPGDYDGDGKFDYAIARAGAAATNPLVWWILQSSNGQVRTQQFGISSDTPVQGDYDGDARTDIAIYRNGATTGSQSTFWVLRSFDNTAQPTAWGVRGDFAVATFDAR